MAEIVDCPKCQRKLRVPDELMGQSVQCPTCGQVFMAAIAGTPPPGSDIAEGLPWEQRAAKPAPQGPLPTPASPRRHPDDYDDWERPFTQRRYQQPHRGVLILVLGILSVAGVCMLLGPVAWVMGNNDLAAMRAGRMDREGEGMTQAGRICGMIATIMMLACGGFYCVIFAVAGMGGGLGK